MKKLIFIPFLVSVIICSSCSSESLNDDFVCLDDVISVSKVISADFQTKSGTRLSSDLVFSAEYSISQDEVLSYSLESVDGSIDEGELNKALEQYLTDELGVCCTNLTEVEVYLEESPEPNGLGLCLRGCKSSYAKGEGRGACRFDCWMGFTLDVVKALIPIIQLF